MRPRAQIHGLTLAEIIVLIAVTSLLTTTLVGLITISLRYYTESNFQTTMETNARQVMDNISAEIRQASGIPNPIPGSPFTNPTPIPSPWPNPSPSPTVYQFVQFTELKPPQNNGVTLTMLDPEFGVAGNPADNYQVVTYYTIADPATNRFYEVLRAVYDPGAGAVPPFLAPTNLSFSPSASPQYPYTTDPSGWTRFSLSAIASSSAGQVSLLVIPTYTDCVALTVLSNEDVMSEPDPTNANPINAKPWTWRYTDELDCKQVAALY